MTTLEKEKKEKEKEKEKKKKKKKGFLKGSNSNDESNERDPSPLFCFVLKKNIFCPTRHTSNQRGSLCFLLLLVEEPLVSFSRKGTFSLLSLSSSFSPFGGVWGKKQNKKLGNFLDAQKSIQSLKSVIELIFSCLSLCEFIVFVFFCFSLLLLFDSLSLSLSLSLFPS